MNQEIVSSINFAGVCTEVAEALRRVTVHITSEHGHGAGVVWSCDGLVVTNAHVATGSAIVRLYDGSTYSAELVGRDPRADLAALRIGATKLGHANLRDSRSVRTGEMVVAVGHPNGSPAALSTGIIHAASSGTWIQSDVRLAPGNSGGPLADVEGKVIGINSMVANGMGIAISTAAIERFLNGEQAMEQAIE